MAYDLDVTVSALCADGPWPWRMAHLVSAGATSADVLDVAASYVRYYLSDPDGPRRAFVDVEIASACPHCKGTGVAGGRRKSTRKRRLPPVACAATGCDRGWCREVGPVRFYCPPELAALPDWRSRTKVDANTLARLAGAAIVTKSPGIIRYSDADIARLLRDTTRAAWERTAHLKAAAQQRGYAAKDENLDRVVSFLESAVRS